LLAAKKIQIAIPVVGQMNLEQMRNFCLLLARKVSKKKEKINPTMRPKDIPALGYKWRFQQFLLITLAGIVFLYYS
jgi:hypothetical protein